MTGTPRQLAGIPLSRTPSPVFEDRVFDLVLSAVRDSGPAVERAFAELTDEQVIYKKGEGAELVFRTRDGIVPKRGQVALAKYFVARRLALLAERIGREEIERSSILDVGTTSGLFLRSFGKTEMGLNYSQRAVEHTIAHGVRSVQGSAEALPFPDEQFDYVFCFQTLEHLLNPVKALEEIARVCRKKAFVTIPYRYTTAICSLDNVELDAEPTAAAHRRHVFELSPRDFERLVERTGWFRVTHGERIEVLGRPRTLRDWVFKRLYGAGEPGFQWFELAVVRR